MAVDLPLENIKFLTKRELFAVKAMAGILSNEMVHGPLYQDNETVVAEKAVLCADALISALEHMNPTQPEPGCE